jgi:glycerophosphoryl diester phosphodiesterase
MGAGVSKPGRGTQVLEGRPRHLAAACCCLLLAGAVLAGAALLFAGSSLLHTSTASAAAIHAHRGGPNLNGAAAFGENSMSAFRNAARAGWVIELDLARTSDGVAVAMHDDTLGRTTDCDGKVDETTWAELGGCRIDRIGIGDVRETLPPGDLRLEPVPSLASIIDMLKETGATANIEVKRVGDFAADVYGQLAASGLDPRQVIIQNFIQGNLDPVATAFPGAATSLLTLNFLNDSLAIQTAVDSGYDWVSPQWPISSQFMSRARAAGLGVAPWTIDDREGLLEAGRIGVDAVITNDPALADRLIGPRPKLQLTVTRRSVRARPGRTATIRLRIRNAGDAPSGPLAIRTRIPRVPLRPVGSTNRRLAGLGPGAVRTLAFRFVVRRSIRPGRGARVSFRLSGSGSPAASGQAVIRVLRKR